VKETGLHNKRMSTHRLERLRRFVDNHNVKVVIP
jgi:hypothetical protein